MLFRNTMLATVAMSGVVLMVAPASAADPAPVTPAPAATQAPTPADPATPTPPATAAAPATPTPPATAAAPATPVRLTGLAAWGALVGNTVQGIVEGKDYFEFYLQDGKVKSMLASTLETGKWSVEGNKVCIVFPSEDKECYQIEVIGDIVDFTDDHGKGVRWMILKGNPKSL